MNVNKPLPLAGIRVVEFIQVLKVAFYLYIAAKV